MNVCIRRRQSAVFDTMLVDDTVIKAECVVDRSVEVV